MRWLRPFLELQIRASKAFDTLLPKDMSVDGSRYFLDEFVSPLLRPGMVVYDVGSGRHPVLGPDEKAAAKLKVVGLDLSGEELNAAPAGAYDDTVTADITRFAGHANADLVLSHAVLEHVRDTRGALAAIESIAAGGGEIALFVPSRNAAFARLNLLLPEKVKLWMLGNLSPNYGGGGGWPAFYDRCTPRDFRRIAKELGLQVIELKPFFMSSYFMICFPLWVAWRLWMLAARAIAGENAAETFCIRLVKPA